VKKQYGRKFGSLQFKGPEFGVGARKTNGHVFET
jgi:hypothetical protein